MEKDQLEYEWPYTNLAEVLLKGGDAQRAFDSAAKAANRNPASARSFYIGAKALFELGRTDLAVNWLQRSVALDATSSAAWYYLARVYRKLGQTEKAAGRVEIPGTQGQGAQSPEVSCALHVGLQQLHPHLDSCRFDSFERANPKSTLRPGSVELRWSYASWTALRLHFGLEAAAKVQVSWPSGAKRR